jgi:hypothetical protein
MLHRAIGLDGHASKRASTQSDSGCVKQHCGCCSSTVCSGSDDALRHAVFMTQSQSHRVSVRCCCVCYAQWRAASSTEPAVDTVQALQRTCLICASTLCRGVTGCGTKELHTNTQQRTVHGRLATLF